MANTTSARVASFINTVLIDTIVAEGKTAGMVIHQRAGHIEVFTTLQYAGDVVVIRNNATGESFDSSRSEADEVLRSAATNAMLDRDRALRALAA